MSVWRKLPVFVYPQDNAEQMARAGSACAHRHLTQAEQLSCISFYFSACTIATTSIQKLLVSFHTEKEQLLSQHKADFGSVAFQKPQAHDFIYPQHD